MNQRPDKAANSNETDEASQSASMQQAIESNAITPDDLIATARAYFATEFTHATTSACPPAALLQTKARSGTLPDEALRTHLFGCSTCFVIYRTALTEGKAAAQESASLAATNPPRLRETRWSGWRNLFGWPTWGWAVALLIAFSGAWFYLRRDVAPTNPTRLAQRAAPANPAPTMPAAEVTASPVAAAPPATLKRKPVSATQATGPKATPLVQQIDLNEFLALRAIGSETSRPQRELVLRPTLTRLQLRLPEGSVPTTYQVMFVDEADQVRLSVPTRSLDGQTLQISLPLQKLTAGRWRLRLQAHREPPLDFPVRVQP